MSAPPKQWNVTVIEWLAHRAVIQATSAATAEAAARQLWAENAEHQLFDFEDSGIDGVVVEEICP